MDRKQVRFNNPSLQHAVKKMSKENANTSACRQVVLPPTSTWSQKQTKPFEEIYMANIPNRQLDLSHIQVNGGENMLPNYWECETGRNENCQSSYNTHVGNENKERDLRDECVRERGITEFDDGLCSSKENLSEPPIDLYNYKPERFAEQNDRHNLPSSYTNYREWKNNNVQTVETNRTAPLLESNNIVENKLICAKAGDQLQQDLVVDRCHSGSDPSVKDLLGLIHQQNEQIVLLQKQVATLTSTLLTQVQCNSRNGNDAQPLTSSTHYESRKFKQLHSKPHTKRQFSVDVMTSFEVSIRRQPPHVPSKYKNVAIQEPRIQEIVEHENVIDKRRPTERCTTVKEAIENVWKEVDSERSNSSSSISINALPVNESTCCFSPEPSINITMKDYSPDNTSSSGNSISGDGEDASDNNPDIGYTFYNNVLGQVNKLLTKKRQRSDDNFLTKNNRTSNRAKETAMQHPIFVQEANRLSERETESDNCCGSEVSFELKQFLMKYLSNDELTKIDRIPVKPSSSPVRGGIESRQNFVQQRPEFSLATYKYMQKYNLLAHDPKYMQSAHDGKVQQSTQKFLDITALKRQPKLL